MFVMPEPHRRITGQLSDKSLDNHKRGQEFRLGLNN